MKNDTNLLRNLCYVASAVILAIALYNNHLKSEREKAYLLEKEKEESLAQEAEKRKRTIVSDFALKCKDEYVVGSKQENKIYLKSSGSSLYVFNYFLVTDNFYKFSDSLKPIYTEYTLDRKDLYLKSEIFADGKPLKSAGYGYSITGAQCTLLDSNEALSKLQEFHNEINNSKSLEEQEIQRKQKIRDEYNNSPNKF